MLGLLLVGAVVVGVLLLNGGDDEGEREPRGPHLRRDLDGQQRSTVRINTRGPRYDNDGNHIVANGGGSGIVFDATRALVLTNEHVVAGPTSIKARLEYGEANARVRGRAPCEDLAVLELRRSPRPQAGELGRPPGLGQETRSPRSASRARSRRSSPSANSRPRTAPSPPARSGQLDGSLPNVPALIQHQAPISPGNLGGPLFDDPGEVVGINTLAATAEGGAQNQNGAISIDRAKSLLSGLENGEDSAYVGWSIQNIAELDNGLFVISVDSNATGRQGPHAVRGPDRQGR